MDNGVEFSDCNGIEKSLFGGKRTKCYYCHPYCSSERGSNEKQNQMLRRHFPKGTDFSKVSEREMSFATSWLNNYPRKLFNWRTSQQLFDEEMRKISSTPPPIFFSKKLLH